MTKHFDIIIVGGGISGISFAQEMTKQNINYCLFEKNEIGGCIKTKHYKDFWFEQGAHTLYNSYGNTISYIEKNNLLDKIINRTKLPFLFVTSNNKVQSLIRNLNIFSLAFNFIKNKNISKIDKSISEYATKAFGEKNYNNTLKYCFDAVLSQNSEFFPMEYLFKKYPRNKNLPRSFTLEKGLSSLFAESNKLNINNEEVLNIKKLNDNWEVTTKNNTYTAKNICLATEWGNTKKLLENIAPEISEHSFQPTTSEIYSTSIIINSKDIEFKKIAGLIGKEQFFYSTVSRDIINHPNLRALTFHCKKNNGSENLLKISKLLKLDLDKVLDIQIKQNTLPCYNKKHSLFIKDLDNFLLKNTGIYLTGNFFDRLAIENCIKRSYTEALRYTNNNT
ncbi:NAD(P)-binding protein [Francisella frigiditurris]|uniref:FAD dependent oxidoreductase family protein n=1 Tax=Francisella frigiditurris TaxID=1542390 RepID=A0A1J0KVZ3_9GAMM|nr:NAD(P)-binding protein [Francisella frigiditurris]APC97992.1 FAD dependent oxidoreductase family protein [Francisella frigiditurris]